MTTTTPLSLDRLVPDGATVSLDRRIRMLPAGVLWDAVRTPEDLALPILARLIADPTDHSILGPVLHDERSRQVHWLALLGHSSTYPDGCRLLGAGDWLATPSVRRPHGRLHWLHLPAPAALSAPAWPATALREQPDTAPLGEP